MGISWTLTLICMQMCSLLDPWVIPYTSERSHWRKEHSNIPYQCGTAGEGSAGRAGEVNCEVGPSILACRFFERGLILHCHNAWAGLCVMLAPWKTNLPMPPLSSSVLEAAQCTLKSDLRLTHNVLSHTIFNQTNRGRHYSRSKATEWLCARGISV